MEQMDDVVEERDMGDEIFCALVDLIGPERMQILVNYLLNDFVLMLAQDHKAEQEFFEKLAYVKNNVEDDNETKPLN